MISGSVCVPFEVWLPFEYLNPVPSYYFTRFHHLISLLAPDYNFVPSQHLSIYGSRGQLKCDGKRAETRFRLSAKWTSPFKSARASVQSTTGSRGVRISGSNAGYTMFRGSVKGTGYPLHSPVSPSLPLPCVTCAITSTEVYLASLSELATAHNSSTPVWPCLTPDLIHSLSQHYFLCSDL